MIDVSVIVPLYNGAPTILRQLEALDRQTFTGRFEVIVADNGSTDGGLELVSSWISERPRFRLISVDRPGAPAARNDAAGQAAGKLLAFCDDDDEVEPQWLAAYAAALPAVDDPPCQLVGALDIESLAPRATLGAREARTRPPGTEEHPYGIGANTALRRDRFVSMGGFSEEVDLRCGYDVDFSWRLLEAGGRIVFVPDAVVRKSAKPTLRRAAGQWFEYGRSSIALHRRHPQMRPGTTSSSTRRRRRRLLWARAGEVLRHPWAQRWVVVEMAAYQAGRLVGPPRRTAATRHVR